MAATIQHIELPKKPRARDTSTSVQAISQELIVNGDFASNTAGWGKVNATMTGGKGVLDAIGPTYLNASLYQLILNQGRKYRLVFDVSGHNGDTTDSRVVDLDENTIYDITGDATGIIVEFTHKSVYPHIFFQARTGSAFDIDNVSILEIESFPNNNHGEIYSGRALEFDGVTDNLTTGSDIEGVNKFSDGTAWTVTLWVYFARDAAEWYVGDDGGGYSMFVKNSGQYLRFREVTGGAFHNFNGTNPVNLNTWYRQTVVCDGTTLTCYLNGEIWGSAITPDSTLMYFTNIGMPYETGGVRYYALSGMMSDFQVWNTAWTATDVTYDYLNPESLALNASGSALTESNLKLWYPMQDGHRGQQSYILDGANTGLGVELVSEGNFSGADDGDPWVKENGSTISGGVGNVIANGDLGNDGANWSLYQDVGMIVGKTYKISFSAKQTGGTGNFQVAQAYLLGFNQSITSSFANYSFFITARDYEHNTGKISIGGNVAGDTFEVDNISVKAINDKHHATTVFYGDELVENESFAASGDWTAQTGWTVSGNDVATVDSSAAGTTYLTSTGMAVVVGRTYYAEMYVDSASGTGLRFDLGGLAGGSYLTTTGLRTATITASTTAGFSITAAGSDTDAQVSRVSVKEIGVASGWTDADQQLHIPQTALQSYNELAWFDGTIASNSYVDLDNEITTSGNSWSLSFWVFHDDNGQNYDFIVGDGTNQIITLNNNTVDRLSYRDDGNEYHAISDAAIPESEWVHIAITATADTSITAYVNGVAQATALMANTTLLLERFMRGYSSSPYSTFGTITEISYYSDVLTSAEALDLFNDGKAKSALEASGSAGLVGYWRNNGLGGWKDLKGSNDGNTSAGVVETILIPQGVDTTRDSQGFLMNKKRSTGSLNFTNPDDEAAAPAYKTGVAINNSPTVDITSDLTICGWIKRKDNNENYNIIQKKTSWNTAGYGLYYHTDGKWYAEYTSTISSDGSATAQKSHATMTFPLDEWYFICFTHKDSGTDVQYQASSSDTALTAVTYGNAKANIATNTEPILIGSGVGGTNSKTAVNFSGQLDGFTIYNKTLDATEVLRNFKATKGSHRN